MENNEVNLHSKEGEEQNKFDKYLWLGFPTIILIWLLYCWFGYKLFLADIGPDLSLDRLNTLFSGLAFWGVIWAILLQKRELIFQRHELELTRQEVRGQKEQLEAQNLTMQQQRFENTFFSLLDLFNGIVNSIEITRVYRRGDEPCVMAKGRECFTTFTTELSEHYADMRKAHRTLDSLVLCQKAYEAFSHSRQSLVGHYFRTFCNIVKFIDTSDISDKKTYMNILRAQLSSSELTLLFYNCLSDYGSEKLKPLVEKYELMENMAPSTLIIPEHRQLLNELAFHSPS